MKKEHERNSGKGRNIVLVVITVNATVSMLLIAAVIYSLTRITQQQQEITSLRNQLQRYEKTQPRSNTQKAADDLEFEGKKSFRYAINTKSKEKEKHEENDENGKENKKPEEPRVLTNEISSKHSKCCGIRGKRGRHGPKGEKGDRGEKGDEGRDGRDGPPGSPGRDGIPGKHGTKGDKGSDGMPGPKGSKGDRGPAGQEQYAESAHFIGKGGAIKPTLLNRKVITSWTVDHKSDSMSYSNGYLTIGVDGYYYIYSQVFYYANTSINGHSMFINDRRVLKAVQSIVNGSMIYHTKYIGGVFKIAKGQKVSVRTHISGKPFYFEKPSSYFGAFLIRKV